MQFEELSLADCASHIVDNRGRTCPVGDSGLPLIATNCIRNDYLYPRYETSRYVSEETYQSWFRGHPQPGDLIFVTKGSPGRVCVAPNPVDFCIAQDMVAIRVDEKKVYPKYLFAALRSEEVQRRITNMHVGTLIPHFKKGDFDKLYIPIAPQAVQRWVGDMYFDLSSRIDLLERTNSTLESIAQALFESWFINFDPVRAKAEGREPEGIDAGTAALFPNTIGTWLQNWRRVAVGEAVSSGTLLIGDGYRAKNSELGYPGVGFVRAGDLLNGCITPTEDFLSLTSLDKARSKMAKVGDTAFTSKGTIGRFAYVNGDASDAVYSPQVCFWRSLNNRELHPAFLHFWMKSRLFSAQVDMVRGQAAIMDFVSLSDQ